MAKERLSFATDDVSALAMALRRQLTALRRPPSHVEVMNMLARAVGFRNFQHWRARNPPARLPSPPLSPQVSPMDKQAEAVRRALRYYDREGQLVQWPARTAIQHLCLWGLWIRIPAGVSWTEREFNRLLMMHHRFGDPAILRRILCQRGLMNRTRDGRAYCRIEQDPPPLGLALIEGLSGLESPGLS